MESPGFVDLLKDTICMYVMGRDVWEMCGDWNGNTEKGNDVHCKVKKKYIGILIIFSQFFPRNRRMNSDIPNIIL